MIQSDSRQASAEELAEQYAFSKTGNKSKSKVDWDIEAAFLAGYKASEYTSSGIKDAETGETIPERVQFDEKAEAEAKIELESLRAENEALKEFKQQWDEKDGNSPGYNLEKAKLYGSQAADYRAKLQEAEKEIAKLKTCEQLLNEPVSQAAVEEMIKRLQSWHYHVSNRDQFKEMELQRELEAEGAKNTELSETIETIKQVNHSNMQMHFEVVSDLESKLKTASEALEKVKDVCGTSSLQWKIADEALKTIKGEK